MYIYNYIYYSIYIYTIVNVYIYIYHPYLCIIIYTLIQVDHNYRRKMLFDVDLRCPKNPQRLLFIRFVG